MPKPNLNHTKSIVTYKKLLMALESEYRASLPGDEWAAVISQIAKQIKAEAEKSGAKLPEEETLQKVWALFAFKCN